MGNIHTLAHDLLRQRAEMWSRIGHGHFDEWLLANGETCAPRVRPIGLPLMRIKQCYANSLRTLMYDLRYTDEWVYTEGVAVSEDIPILINHAWLTNRKGEVLDRTLRRRKGVTSSYFGIPFTREAVRERTLKQGYFGLFSNGMTYNDIVGSPVIEERAWEREET